MVPGWYDENARRAYPLVDTGPLPRTMTRASDLATVTWPDDALREFMATVGPWMPGFDATGIAAGDPVWLASVSRAGDGLSVTFAFGITDLPVDRQLTFTVAVADRELTTTAATVLVVDGDPDRVLWDGVLVTGRLDDLLAVLPAGDRLDAGPDDLVVEPGRIVTVGPRVRSLNLAVAPRDGGGDPVVVQQGLAGDVAVEPGYNATARTVLRTSTLVLGGQVGGGLGEPAAEVPRYPGETPPAGSTRLSGGPRCTEVVLGLNGISADRLDLVGVDGVRVSPDPDDPNGLLVHLDPGGGAACDDET